MPKLRIKVLNKVINSNLEIFPRIYVVDEMVFQLLKSITLERSCILSEIEVVKSNVNEESLGSGSVECVMRF